MIPCSAMVAWMTPGKPRASGDDPDPVPSYTAADTVNPARAGMIRRDLADLLDPEVNPARAGMIRGRRRPGRRRSRKPRASGDDPPGESAPEPALT